MIPSILSNLANSSSSLRQATERDRPDIDRSPFENVFGTKSSVPSSDDQRSAGIETDTSAKSDQNTEAQDGADEGTFAQNPPQADTGARKATVTGGLDVSVTHPSAADPTTKLKPLDFDDDTPISDVKATERDQIASLSPENSGAHFGPYPATGKADEVSPKGLLARIQHRTEADAKVPGQTVISPTSDTDTISSKDPDGARTFGQISADGLTRQNSAGGARKSDDQLSTVIKETIQEVWVGKNVASIQRDNKAVTAQQGSERTVKQPGRVIETLGAEAARTQIEAPLSMLERHLGGHAPTLLPKSGRDRGLSGFERHRLDIVSSQSAGSLTVSANPVQSKIYLHSGVQTSQLALVSSKAGAGTRSHGPVGATFDFDAVSSQSMDELGFDIRGTSTMLSASPAAAVSKTDLAASVAAQVANAVRQSSDRAVEISLNPVELGRVRMVLSALDAGITVNILADRPDTLDLMRRNIDELGKSFADMGYENISFSFSQGDQTADDNQPEDKNASMKVARDLFAPEAPDSRRHPTPQLALAPGGIDMRL